MLREAQKSRWRLWLVLGSALVGLNLALSYHNVWPTPWVTTRYELSVEAVLLVLIMALYAEWRGPPSRRMLGWLTVVLTLLVLGRYAQVTAPALYGRPVYLFWDFQHLPRVVAMLAEAAPGWLVALVVSTAAALLAALVLTLRWALAKISQAFSFACPRQVVIVLGSAVLALFAIGHLVPNVYILRWFSLPVTPTYIQQVSFLHQALTGRDRSLDVNTPPLTNSSLERVAGADVIVLFLESYGAVTFDRQEYAVALDRSRNVLSQAVARSGRQMVSAYVRSPTFGGASWLAHASFLAGVEVADENRYRLLLTHNRETLVHRFARHGYRTLALMPGLQRPWPEGAFYSFDKIYDAATLDYHGPAFGYWHIPDQYTLARLHDIELVTQSRAPVFLFFATISSHAPFQPIPPYHDDWHALLGAEPFGPYDVTNQLSQKPNWTDLAPAYVSSLDYAMTYIAGYLETHDSRDLVLVILGDHQPPAIVSGPVASWDVPVHVIASRPALIEALCAEGFQIGLKPNRPVIGPLHLLPSKVLRAFDGNKPLIKELVALGSGSGVDVQPCINVAGPGPQGQVLDKLPDLRCITPLNAGEPVALAN